MPRLAPFLVLALFAGTAGKTQSMTKDDAGVWSLTLGPLEPEIYRYNFVIDGLRVTGSVNAWISVGRNSSTSIRNEWQSFPGVHEWNAWRHSLAALLPKLFHPAQP
jgi:S-formylglutathione hydrolase FrmB